MTKHGSWLRTRPGILLAMAAALGVGLLLGLAIFSGKGEERPTAASSQPQESEEEVQWWTCSMHPNVHESEPGRCPYCGMELIPVKKETGEEPVSLRQLTVSRAAKKLMDIQTTPVERRFVTKRVRMVGKIEYDETRLAYITAWVPGRLDKLFVDYTGVTVQKGDRLVQMYSPELLATQEELLQAIRATIEISGSTLGIVKERTQATVEAARERLRLWGLDPQQIQEIEERATPSDHITINAPLGGVVVHKNALEGMYVKTGTRIYTIADLSQVWAKLDAYESDHEWLRHGQEVEFTTESYPGEVFRGRIAFIDPFLDPKTRTAKVRVNVPNPDQRLKPEMFVRGVVKVRVATGGRVMDPAALAEEEAAKPLIIPASAPLVTGKRAVVYVKLPDRERPTFVGKEIVLGPRTGDYYIVVHGLEEGEEVVTQGNFKIDSALQIQAKPSMMTPEGGAAAGAHRHGAEPQAAGEPSAQMQMDIPAAFLHQLGELEAARQAIAEALDTQDFDRVRQSFKKFGQTLSSINPASLSEDMLLLWQELAMLLGNDSVIATRAKTLDEVREGLQDFERHWARLTEQFPISEREHVKPMIAPADFQKQLGTVFDGYLAIQSALAADDDAQAKATTASTREALGKVDMALLEGEAHMAWMTHLESLQKALDQMAQADGIDGRREGFAALSQAIAQALGVFGAGGRTAYVLHCPMAFDNKGADWLQADKEVRNPYFGSQMPMCGDVVREIR